MKRINKSLSLLTLSLLPVLCLSGCKKDEVLDKPVGFGEGKEVIETTTANAGFSIDVDSEFKVNSVNQNVHQYDPIYIKEENVLDSSDLSEEEIDAYYNVVIDPITGEDISSSHSLLQLQSEAQTIYKPLYESGDLSKDDIKTAINIAYDNLSKEDREKVLSEIFASDKEVEVSETESLSLTEETLSKEEIDKIIAEINASGSSVSSGGVSGEEQAKGGGTSGDSGLPAIVAN